MSDKSLARLLFLIDVPDWIFSRHARMLKDRLSDEFAIDIKTTSESFSEKDYDLIYVFEFNLIDPERINDPAKYVTGLRSHVSWSNFDIDALVSLLASKFNSVHVVSKRLYNLFLPFLPEVQYVTHGVDSTFFTPLPETERKSEKVRIGWAGNKATILKGFNEFIKPLEEIPGVELEYCGYGGKNLSMLEMRGFYQGIDIYICTSAKNEGNNNSLMEAACMEKAIITTDNGTVPEYLHNLENAIIVERDLETIIHAVEKLRDDSGLRKTLGRNARKAIITGGWDWREKAEDYRRFFRRALAKQSKPLASSTFRCAQEVDPTALVNMLRDQLTIEQLMNRGYLESSRRRDIEWQKHVQEVREDFQRRSEQYEIYLQEARDRISSLNSENEEKCDLIDRLTKEVDEKKHELEYIDSIFAEINKSRIARFILRRTEQKHKKNRLSIAALGQHNSSSQGSEVWVLSIKSGRYPSGIPLSRLPFDPKRWSLVEDPHVPYGYALVAQDKALLEVPVEAGDDLQIEMLSHPWSGLVMIEVQGRATIIDLYHDAHRGIAIHPSRDPVEIFALK
ncbi:MAG: glycosyltransferase [Chloroflexi bacterium]|nr:glycosyltransferase [Chloroflexota bacterium]